MHFALAYAGIPQDFYDRVDASKQAFLGKAQFFGAPLNGGVLSYDTAYIQRFAGHFAQLIGRDHHNTLSDTAFAVICVEHDTESTNLLKQTLFPSIYCATVKWRPTWGSRMEVQMSANTLIGMLREATQRAKAALKLLHAEVNARGNRTPLLLPVKNFSSDTFAAELRKLHGDLHHADNHEKYIKTAIERITQAHPFERINNSSKRAFVDNRQIIYESPGRDRHAFARPNTGHPFSCILAGTRRLGAPYDHAFHYDCTKLGQARLKGSFFGCHQPSAEYTGDPHLNVAPNDYVRT